MRKPLVVEAEPAFRTEHANPYNARLYRAMGDEDVRVRDLSYLRLLYRRIDIVHLHWPELTFLSGGQNWRVLARLVLFRLLLAIARLRGTRVVWTVHNVSAHESRSTEHLRARYRRLLTENVDGLLALTADGVTAARAAYPELAGVPAFVTPHGHYRLDYDFSPARAEARHALGIPPDVPLMVSVGQIRPYKGIPDLVSAFRATDLDAMLAIAGRTSSADLEREILAAAEGDPRVVTDLVFQSNERMVWWLRAADLVVLPYVAIQNSGSAILALSGDRPVVVPRIGAMAELQDAVGDSWVRTFEGTLDAGVLESALGWARDSARPVVADLGELGWDRIARSTVAAYRTVLAAPRPGSRVVPSRESGTAHVHA
jgi:glycosyltransferase involved in cell wall biosynthesis